MKKIKLLLAATAAMVAVGAQAQTDEQLDAANAAIENGGAYYIYTLYNGTTTGGTKYYLKSDGYLTDNVANATYFTFTLAAGGSYAPGKGYKTGNFTNGGDNSNNFSGVSLNRIGTNSSARDDFEGQVWYLNDAGDFAVRSTNSNSSAWGASAFWTVVEDNDDDGLPNATYTMNGAQYIWKIEKDVKAEAYNTVQSWPYKIQTAEGLVTSASQWVSNAKDPSEGSYEALLDNDYATFFHSTWHDSNDPGEDHYLQAELSEAAQKFQFYFKKRSQNNNNRPTTIVISASNDGTNFEDKVTISEGLPTVASSVSYISDVIDLGAAYKYVRFTVPTTSTGHTTGDHVYFTFSEFYIYPNTSAIQSSLEMVKNTTSADVLTDDDVTQIYQLDETLTAQADLKGNRRALAEALAQAKTIAQEDIPTVAYAALQADIQAYENNSFTTAEEFSNATEKLNSYAAMQEPYAAFKAEVANATFVGVDATEQSTAVANATTAADIETATAALKAAISDAAFDITSFTIKNPTALTKDNWEGTDFGTASDGVCEYWNKQGADFHQTVKNLPAGKYRLTVVALQRTGRTGTVYAGENRTTIAQVASTIVNGRADAATWFNAGNGRNYVYFELTETSDVVIGLTTDAVTADYWTVWQSFALETFDESVAAGYLAPGYDALVAEAEATRDNTAYANVTGSERTALQAAIDATPSTVAEYEAAITALNTTSEAFTAAKKNYDLYVSELAIAQTISSTITVTAPTTSDEALAAFKTLKVAEYNFVKDAYPYSATSKIGEFSTWERTGTVNGAEKNEFEALTSQHWSGTAMTYYEQPAKGWSNNAWTAKYEKTTTLPAGEYIIKVAARAASSGGTTASISCQGLTAPIPTLGDTGKGITTAGVASFDEGEFANDGNGRGWIWSYLPFTLTEETEVTMTVVAEATGLYQWFSVCDGELLSKTNIATAVAYDEASDNVIENVDVANVTMNRIVKADFNSVVLPFDLTAAQVQAAFGTGSEVYAYTEESESAEAITVNFNKVVAGTISANVPVLVKATLASESQVFNGVQVVAAENAKVAGKYTSFVGVYAPETVAIGDYFIGEGYLYKSAGETSIKAFRAYIAMPEEAGEVKMFINGLATRISEINGVAAAENGAIFNLAGQRVNKAQKGIFIQNGKKVIVK